MFSGFLSSPSQHRLSDAEDSRIVKQAEGNGKCGLCGVVFTRHIKLRDAGFYCDAVEILTTHPVNA